MSSARAGTAWWWSRRRTRASWSATAARPSRRCARTRTRSGPTPGCASMLAVGQSLPFRRGGSVSLPLDVSRTLEELLERAELDFVHVHEPFAPSAASAALRHSRALNVGTFHSTTERFVSTQVARKVVELLFGRLDGRTASFAATRDLIERYFPGDYTVIHPGADLLQRAGDEGGPPEIVFSDEEERGALRLFIRALRRLPTDLDWRATIWLHDPARRRRAALSRRLRERVRSPGPPTAPRRSTSRAPRSPWRRRPARRRRRSSSCAPWRAARCPWCRGCRSTRSSCATASSARCSSRATRSRSPPSSSGCSRDPELVRRLRGARSRRHARSSTGRAWPTSTRSSTSASPRAATTRTATPQLRKRLGSRDFVHVDLHMHTDHSPDCATPVDTLLDTAKRVGLGAIAITDHNEISGALEARERANGIKVIVAEEVKTADQGEVIGLFIEEKIPRGMTLQETIAEIRRQGGLVYVPHPFDRMHAVPDYEHLLDVVEDIDAIEVFNPRVAFSAFNEEAARFAAKYRIVAGRRIGQPRGAGARLGEDPHARLRRAGGVPRVAQGRRHRPKEAVAPLRSGAEVHPDARQEVMRSKGPAAGPSKATGTVPATDDEIREKYLERAIRELNQLTRDIQSLRALPARQPDARARLGPPAGGHHAAQVRPHALGDRGGRGVLRPRRQRADEELQAARRSTRSPSTGPCSSSAPCTTRTTPRPPAARACSRRSRSCSRGSSW